MSEYIGREALLAELEEMESHNVSPMYRRGYDDCVAAVKKMPTADVAPVKRARWIGDTCSRCGFIVSQKTRKYCNRCGAKMDGGVDDENSNDL